MLDKQTRALINSARTLGDGPLSVYLNDDELLRLCLVIAADLDQQGLVADLVAEEAIPHDYYGTPLEWFQQPMNMFSSFDEKFLELQHKILDFPTYFKGLTELHKRRLKFKLILEHQALPHIEQIVPRCLLEYGMRPSEALATWLVWRKWLYDIDNRSAQETGYLFEPILASAIGGVPYAARKSPVKRTDNPTKGRQVDCLEGKLAYEFKMRVTIAASGQGRFQEELDFARDCHNSGYIPILLVLDPTPSARLGDLTAEYGKYGGTAHIGDDAWRHLEEKAGKIMGKFIEKYVRAPLREVDTSYQALQPLHLANADSRIEIHIGAESFSIARSTTQLIEPGVEDSAALEE
jgi:hypothetical protein